MLPSKTKLRLLVKLKQHYDELNENNTTQNEFCDVTSTSFGLKNHCHLCLKIGGHCTLSRK